MVVGHGCFDLMVQGQTLCPMFYSYFDRVLELEVRFQVLSPYFETFLLAEKAEEAKVLAIWPPS